MKTLTAVLLTECRVVPVAGDHAPDARDRNSRRAAVAVRFRSVRLLASVVLLLSALAAHAQLVQIFPTNHTLTILAQNNLGRTWADWQDSAQDRITLSNRVLTFVHTVFFDRTMFAGSRGGGPKMLEDTYRFSQLGSAAYLPIGGEEIIFYAPRANGNGWIAATNPVAAVDMVPRVFWLPSFVGTVTIGDRLSHTVTTGSPLVCFGRNIGAGPVLLRVNCASVGARFTFLNRFEQGERKMFTLGITQARAALGENLHWFSVDFENGIEGQEL